MFSSEEMDFCVACLITDVKMYSCVSVINIYFRLVGNELTENQKMCFECVALLLKYSKFREKCRKSQEVLCNLEKYSLFITKDIIRNIDRKDHNLSSNITVSPTKAFFDLDIMENDSENTISNINVKTEDENLALEDEMLIKIEECNNFPDAEIIEIPSAPTPIRDTPEIKKELNKDKVREVSLSDSLEDSDPSYKNDEIDVLTDSSDSNSSYTGNVELDNFIKQELGETKLRNLKYEVLKEKSKPKTKAKVGPTTKRERKVVNKNNSSNTSRTIKKIDLDELRKYADITYLTHETAVQEVQLRKEKSNYKHSMYQCELCFKGFGREITFQNHMHTHNPAFGTCECDYCHIRFNTKRTLHRHFISCHKMKFCCKKCVYECFCVSQAQIHVLSHEGRTYTCQDCGKVFRMPNSLSTHRRLNHIEGVPCDLCGESLGTKRGLITHKRSIHALERNNFEGPKCEECNVHFANEKAWKRHLVLSKNHDVSNGCEFCGETFENDTELNFHKANHVKEKKNSSYYHRYLRYPPECTICNKALNSRRVYEQHMRKYHVKYKSKINAAPLSKEYVCEICGMVFPCQKFSRRNYLMHLRKEHPASELTQSLTPLKHKQYVCEVCGSMFREQCVLKYHQAKHINHKQRTMYNCDKCSKTFLTNAARARHIKVTHFGIRPYSCSVCGKSFHNQCEVNLHTKYVHEKVPWPKRDRSKRNMKTEEGFNM